MQFQAVAGLRGLASHPTIRILLMRERVLEPLLMAANDGVADLAAAIEAAEAKAAKKRLPAGAAAAAAADPSPEAALSVAQNPSEKPGGSVGPTVDREVLREVAATFVNLACAEENKVAMVNAGVGIPVIALSKSSDRVLQTHAGSCLANLCEMLEGGTHKRLLSQGLVKVSDFFYPPKRAR